MHNVVAEMLDAVKAKRSLASDRALAKLLGVTPQTVSQWRQGTVPLSLERVAELADLAQEHAGEWILAHGASTATTPELKGAYAQLLSALHVVAEWPEKKRAAFWADVMRVAQNSRKKLAKLGTAAALAMVAAGLQLAPSTAQAFDFAGYSPQMYIMSIRRRLAVWIRAVFTPAGLTPFVPA